MKRLRLCLLRSNATGIASASTSSIDGEVASMSQGSDVYLSGFALGFRRWIGPLTPWLTLLVLCLSFSILSGKGFAQDSQDAAEGETQARQAGVKIVFLAGRPSHGYGAHEHLAGCRVLAEAIENATENVQCEVYGGGWPEDDSVLDDADSIVMYCDGGGGHPALRHLDRLGELMDRGIGFACLHYAVEVPKDNGGPEFLEWLGGYFETHWSVNPHWVAEFNEFPEHPVTRGVEPFSANDEWYFHMRFRPEMEGVTPILSAIAPDHTMRRPDGPHSGNPAVREAVANEVPQHTAWVYERPGGGRSFGFTGGHYHWNWGRRDILRLVSNAIVWTAKGEVPEGGLPVLQPGVEELQEGQDEDVPDKHDPERIQEEFKISKATDGSENGSTKDRLDTSERDASVSREPRLLWKSEVITKSTDGHRTSASLDVSDVEQLYLVCSDAGDGFTCDWADWIAPTVVDADGQHHALVEREWLRAEAGWGEVRRGKNAAGGPLRIAGERFDEGIGTHADSVIGFELPEGARQFDFICGLDNGGTDQGGGNQTSVQFFVFAEGVPDGVFSSGSSGGSDRADVRKPENAVAGLTIHPELQATLAASEPDILSLTNIDIDHRGRIWACEVVNYRGHNGERPEGDRILILEDTDGDGVCEDIKVFYQGRDVDSAMGICVLGNQVIVSASPKVLIFTDEDGDDRPDRKEVLFSETGQPQHDHSAHSFVFGPDGKLYWNFGNTGQAVHDADGELITAKSGHEVIDNGQPYFGGMVFRCEPDGTEFEVLAHNFRNNYEVAVDSFGGLWQSDNDDDGNRATRINFILEYGNYGYRDEMTGAGWRTPRDNLEATIPEQHWHLNDPGVVPNLLLTGAGSPTGITVYESDLLPEVFQGQVLHCDAGPSVVRAYPVEESGAGYTASIENMMVGEIDPWFRPADICVAPDGSLFVSDWYDPGVGGHRMGDTDRGRLFRLAPPDTPYRVPEHDFESVEGLIQALKSPNQSVRYFAWRGIERMAGDVEREAAIRSDLKKLATDENPRFRARAVWALGKLTSVGKGAVRMAFEDPHAQVRAMGIRLARQLELPSAEFAAGVVDDESPHVRRELAIALRFDRSEAMPKLWGKLAGQYDGQDRWYLEALGIGAELRWDDCLDAYLEQAEASEKPVAADIMWRGRCHRAAMWQADQLLARSPSGKPARWLRALDFQSVEHQQEAFSTTLRRAASMLRSKSNELPNARTQQMLVESLIRLSEGRKLSRQPEYAKLVAGAYQAASRERRLEMLRELQLGNPAEKLLSLIASGQFDSTSVEACQRLIAEHDDRQLMYLIAHAEPDRASQLARILAATSPNVSTEPLRRLLDNDMLPPEVRVLAAKGLASSKPGAEGLLKLAEADQLYPEARFVVGSILREHANDQIRKRAAIVFPIPVSASRRALPPLSTLVEQQGDAQAGALVFKTKGTCNKCHLLDEEGKNVGPDLSEIGDKLAKEAMYVSILDPSAGISHNYETYAALLDSGQVVTGLMVSQTDASVTIRDAEGIDRELSKESIDQLKKQDQSLMPANLVENLSEQELVDLVEYLLTLSKAD
jgi:putative membrane-bound dehydrogenase-like protein